MISRMFSVSLGERSVKAVRRGSSKDGEIYVKLQKSKMVVQGRTYDRYLVYIPVYNVVELGWIGGDDLVGEVRGEELVLRRKAL